MNLFPTLKQETSQKKIRNFVSSLLKNRLEISKKVRGFSINSLNSQAITEGLSTYIALSSDLSEEYRKLLSMVATEIRTSLSLV